MPKELALTLVLCVNGGVVIPLFSGVHIEAKKSLNRLVLVQKSERNLPYTNKVGITGIFYYIKSYLVLTSVFWEPP